MKLYTDLEQSKKLSTFLPTESADMFYCYGMTVDDKEWNYDKTPTIIDESNKIDAGDIPCWSLAVLLKVLFAQEQVRLVGTKDSNHWYCEIIYSDRNKYAGFGSSDNPVDACYEMIIRLHNQKLL